MYERKLIYNCDSYNLDEIDAIVSYIISIVKQEPYSVWLLEGDLGAGKTTLIKNILYELGIDGVDSPTFSIINEYEDRNNKIVYHMDCYRIESTEEVLNIGIEEILSQENLIFIEWPEVMMDIITRSFYIMKLHHLEEEDKRSLKIYKVENVN